MNRTGLLSESAHGLAVQKGEVGALGGMKTTVRNWGNRKGLEGAAHASAAAWRPAAAVLAASCVADVASAAADGSASPTASATLPSLASMDSAVSGATAAARLCVVTSGGGLRGGRAAV